MLFAQSCVAIVKDEPAGLWWAAGSALLALDGYIIGHERPAALLPFTGNAAGPTIAWLGYRGAACYVERPVHSWSISAAVIATLGWFILSSLGQPALAEILTDTTNILLGFSGIALLVKGSASPLGRLVAIGYLLPILLVASTHWLRFSGLDTPAETELWTAAIFPFSLIVICALLERDTVRTRLALEETTRRLQLAARISGLGTWTYHRDQEELNWSEEMFEIYKVDPKEGATPFALQLRTLPQEQREEVSAAMNAALDSGQELNLNLKFNTSDGETRHVATRAQRYLRPDGSIVLVGSTYDLTKLRKAIEELECYRTQLQELVAKRTAERDASQNRLHQSQRLASLGTFSAGLAHQVNNPVGSILVAAEFSELCVDDSDEIVVLRRAISDIKNEARRCGEIVRGVLQFASDQPTKKTVVRVDSVLANVRVAMGGAARRANAKLEVECFGESPWINASQLEVEQAISNLIENAFQSRESGAAVKLLRYVDGKNVRIEIRDNGVGIPEESLERIRDPFFTTRLEAGGTGLGLSIAHGIVEEHGGSLSFESKVDIGTEATLSLPSVAAPPSSQNAPSSEPNARDTKATRTDL